jgi:Tol biopolymer transport system component
VAEDTLDTANGSHVASPQVRLDSWKEIAAYVKRDVTTVRRWEKREGLPVHRQLHARRDSVYAYPTEIDAWWKARRNDLAGNGAADSPASAPGEALWRQRWVPWTIAGLLAIVVVVAGTFAAKGREEKAQFRFPILPPANTSVGTMAVSPDGRHVAFSGTTDGGATRLWIQHLDSLTATSLPDTDDATLPFWSPDSDAIGFFAAGKLWTIDVAGGAPQSIADAPHGRGGTWNRDGIIVFAPDATGPLVSVAVAGGNPRPVTALGLNERGHLWPEFLPDGRRFLFLADAMAPEYHSLSVGDLSTRRVRNLFRLASSAVYAQGYLLYERERKLLAQPFDAERLQVSGDPLTLADHVVQPWSLDHKTDVSVSSTGVLAFRSMGGFNADLVWRDRSEQRSAFSRASAGYSDPVFSPDQTRLAVGIFHPQPSRRYGFGTTSITSDVWLLDRSTGAATAFTSDPGAEFEPVWSPDGRRIAYSSNRRGTLDLYQKYADGGGNEELLYASPERKHALTWSPDGRFLVFAAVDAQTRFDLWLLPMTGDRRPTPLVCTHASEQQVQVSPDGRWFAYTSDESGRPEVYVQRFPSPTDRWQVSTHGGGDARWSADGRQLFYIATDRQLMSVPIQAVATFAHGKAVALFDTGMSPDWGTSRNHYDVTRDGRVLMMAPVADDRTSPFTIVVNWNSGLEK